MATTRAGRYTPYTFEDNAVQPSCRLQACSFLLPLSNIAVHKWKKRDSPAHSPRWLVKLRTASIFIPMTSISTHNCQKTSAMLTPSVAALTIRNALHASDRILSRKACPPPSTRSPVVGLRRLCEYNGSLQMVRKWTHSSADETN